MESEAKSAVLIIIAIMINIKIHGKILPVYHSTTLTSWLS
jgi:hypothetical protein